ncbi:MAG: hypothetical protein IPO81_14210 [Kouleothrix sp.]|nr:hypothetical protein [Kouleothrix sp.]
MPQQRSVRCTNCGTKWTPKAGVAACPVCQLPMSKGEAALKRAMSADDLSSQLGALITSARASGLSAATIVQALRDELEFAAEMAQAGRHFCVQLIDLGPQESNILQRPLRDRREILQTRSVN